MPPPITIFPTSERFVDIARETTAAGTIPASPGSTVPVTQFKPSDKPMWLPNTAWYGDMGDIHGIIQGPMIGGFDISGPYFGDMVGHVLYNLLGDYTALGTAASPAGTVNAPITAGATTLSVASGGASFTAGMFLWIQDAGTPVLNEVVKVLSSTATVITLDPTTPCRFAHLTATPFTNTTAPYTHVFSLLNSNTSIGNGAGQPVTHTFTDRTGIPATNFAAQYGYSCFHEFTLTGNAEQLLTWEAKAISNVRAIAASPLSAPAASAVTPYPSWRSTTKLTPVGGGALALVNDVAEWAITITRQVKPYFTNQGSQSPYVIARGRQGATGKLTISPAIDESSILYLLANTQPQIQIAASNGLAGASLVSAQADIGLAAYESADIADGDELFGYDVGWTAVHSGATFNTITMTGATGMAGCIKFTLQNAIPTY
jgi:hypothetical protein